MTAFTEWRELGENLARVASIREKAESPMDRIAVQVRDGVMKVVAGDFHTTMVYTLGPTEQANGMAVVPARLFLGTLKTLKGKGEATLTISDKGASLTTSFGSSIDMDQMDGLPHYLKPLPYRKGVGTLLPFPAGFLPQATKYLYATADYAPFDQVLVEAANGQAYFRASDDHILGEAGPLEAPEDFRSHLYPDAVQALRGIDIAGGFWFPPRVPPYVQQAQVIAGPWRIATVVRPNYGRLPAVAGGKYATIVSGEKKPLIETFKSLAGRHQYSRVIMEAKGGDFTVKAGDNGKATLAGVKVEGEAFLPVNAQFMAKVMQVVDGKTVTIEFSDAPSNIRVIGDSCPWSLVVAPMK